MDKRIRIVVPVCVAALLLLGCFPTALGQREETGPTGPPPGWKPPSLPSTATTDEDVAYSKDEPEPVDPATLEEIFIAGNGMAVYNGGKPATWKVDKPLRIREFWTYHWNEEKGAPGGTIYLKKPDGTLVAEFPVTRTLPGQGGVPNAYWVADIDFELQPGTYVVSDSDPATWAQNEQTGGVGMAWVKVEKR